MAQLPSSFREESHGDMGEFAPLPAGLYNVRIVDSAYKETKAKTGHYLEWKFEIIDGENAGKFIWDRMNLDNPNSTAVDLANKALATLMRACGVAELDDSEELHGQELTIDLKFIVGKGDNPDSNNIRKYLPLDGAERPAGPASDEDEKSSGEAKPKRRPVFSDDD